MCISLFLLKHLCNPLLYRPSICSNLICFKVQVTLGVQLGLDKPIKSIFESEGDMNYFDKFMRLQTQNRIFEITSISSIFDLIVLCWQLDGPQNTVTWIIAQVVTPVFFQLHMLFCDQRFYSVQKSFISGAQLQGEVKELQNFLLWDLSSLIF